MCGTSVHVCDGVSWLPRPALTPLRGDCVASHVVICFCFAYDILILASQPIINRLFSKNQLETIFDFNKPFGCWAFSKTRDWNELGAQTGRMKCATRYISFETKYISSETKSIRFEITCTVSPTLMSVCPELMSPCPILMSSFGVDCKLKPNNSFRNES